MNCTLKNIVGCALILWFLAGSYSIVQYVSIYERSTEPASFRSFTVTGEEKSAVVPDIAEVAVGVVSEGGTDIAKLQEDNTGKANAIIAFLKSRKIDAKDISTKNYLIDPRYQYASCSGLAVCPPPKITGYTIRQDIGVKIRDFKEVGYILEGVVLKGANTVSQLQFTVDDPVKIEREVREKAISKAKAKAQEIAKAGGFKVGRLLSISEGPRSYPPLEPVYGFGYGGAKEISLADAPSIEPGSQEVAISVSLTYEIEQ